MAQPDSVIWRYLKGGWLKNQRIGNDHGQTLSLLISKAIVISKPSVHIR